MRSRRSWFVIAAALALSFAGTSLALAASQGPKHHGPFGTKHNGPSGIGGPNRFAAILVGHNEVPAIHTGGMGKLTLTLNDNNTISFELTYANLSSPAVQAHVHFGQPNVNGGVVFYFCGGPKPACPAGNTSTPATVTGTIAASDILAQNPNQGIAAGDIAGLISEMKAGFTYANVHTQTFQSGEIRGQVFAGRHGFGQGHDDDND